MKRYFFLLTGLFAVILILGRKSHVREPRHALAESQPTADPLVRKGLGVSVKSGARMAESQKLLRELVDEIQQDNYCQARDRLVQKSQSAENPERDRDTLPFRALVEASGEKSDPCMLALLARTRADVLRFAAKSDALECRLVKGLLLADLWNLTHVAPPAKSEEKAEGLAILTQLAQENGDNGFFSFVRLGAIPEGEEAAREEAYRDFLRARNFVNPLSWPVKEKLMRLARGNATAWLLTSELGTGWVNFTPAIRAVKTLPEEVRGSREFSPWVDSLAERFAATDREGLAEPFVNLFDDATLRSVVMMGRNSLSAMPKIFEQPNWVAYFKRRHPWEPADFVPNESCDRLIERAREKFPQLVRKSDEQAELVRHVRM